jgi:hypothetical protein
MKSEVVLSIAHGCKHDAFRDKEYIIAGAGTLYCGITKYVRKSISNLQIQVATYIFQSSEENCHC